ncbi:MAG: hypothetical protein ACJ8DG_11050 [Microvirga sp.]
MDIADRDYFQRALQTKQFVVSDYVTTRVRNQPAIIAALPALDDTATSRWSRSSH